MTRRFTYYDRSGVDYLRNLAKQYIEKYGEDCPLNQESDLNCATAIMFHYWMIYIQLRRNEKPKGTVNII